MSHTSDWAHELFVNNASVYQPVLESGLATAPGEVRGLRWLFRKYGHEKKNRRFRILDASCGIGRHSVMLAGEGYEVVGYDPSQAFIERARELARERNERGKSNIRFYRGPITEIRKTLARSGESGFDAIISMGAAFGYSGREKDDLSLFKDLNHPEACRVAAAV